MCVYIYIYICIYNIYIIYIYIIYIYYYNNNITSYYANSNYYTTLQGRYHGERKDNDYPVANKKTRNIILTNNYTTI